MKTRVNNSQSKGVLLLNYVLLLIVLTFLVGCANGAKTVNWEGLSQDTQGLPPIRYKALKRGALSYGAQKGLAWRAKQINNSLKGMADELDQAFKFHMLLLNHSVIPPVLSEAGSNLNTSGPNTIRVADATYHIVKPAHFVTTTPSWRDYLILNYKEPESPNPTFLPKNEKEKQVWNQFVKQGWEQGITQADSIFEVYLARLKRDYLGMALYKKLLSQNMVTPPKIVETQLGITGGGQELRINDRFARITKHSNLKPNTAGWQPVLHSLKNKQHQPAK